MKFKEYQTTSKNKMFKENQLSLDCHKLNEVIKVDDSKIFQEIIGFGASFTDSSAYLIDEVLTPVDKKNVMKKLFHPKDGIGISVLRNPMGASDYSRTVYSYCDERGEEDLEYFSIAHDERSILPLTKEAMRLNSNLKLFASPWSAPGWMKTSNNMLAGELKSEYYDTYGNYFVKFIECYEKQGVPIFAITVQNEPLYEPKHYPSMFFPEEKELEFVKSSLYPKIRERNLTTKILGYDHNWDRLDYPLGLLDKGKKYFDGIAWHWYGGKPVSQSRVKRDYPDKEVYFTEGSGGSWIPEFEPAFSNLIRTGIDILRNDAKTFILWNIALDENNGPTVPGFGKSTCRGLLKINQQDKSYSFTQDYYGLAHFSKFIFPGAIRISSTESENIKSVAFRNKDHSTVLVLFNDSDLEISLKVEGLSDNFQTNFAAKETKTIIFY